MFTLSPEDQAEEILGMRMRLRKRGYSLRRLAREYGYTAPAVSVAVRRYWCSGQKPKGLVQRQILRDIRRILGQPIPHGNGHPSQPSEDS